MDSCNCSTCNGSGEGMSPGTICKVCNGLGEVSTSEPDDEDVDDEEILEEDDDE